MKKALLCISLVLLFAAEISRVYFIMPFPGSQKATTISFAYWMENNIAWIRIVLFLLIIFSIAIVFRHIKTYVKVLLGVIIIFYCVVFYYFNFKFQADKMFLQPKQKIFADASANKVNGDKLVIGVVQNGVAKAYPIQVIGYHHQVRDTVGGIPVMITYCTVCRTGRVFRPFVNGKPETFRLVGMDHFNAMFEDATTRSWWRQVTGVAIAGKLKGKVLEEIPSEQATLSAWLQKYPHAQILQPDTNYLKRYKSLADFDNGTTTDDLEKRDSASWKLKSWVIGIDQNGHAKAYDWNLLVSKKWIQDSLPGLPLLITLEKDTATFHVFNRTVRSVPLRFHQESNDDLMTDDHSGSKWNRSGACVVGPFAGEQLARVQSYQEFWHSWKTFHPRTARY